MSTSPSSISSDSLIDNFRQTFALCAIRQSRWLGIIQLPKNLKLIDVRIGGQSSDPSRLQSQRIRLLPDKWNKRFTTVYHKVKLVLEKRTQVLPGMPRGLRLISAADHVYVDGKKISVIQDLKEQVGKIQDELDQLTNELAACYQEEVVQANYDYWWPRLRSHYAEIIGRKIPFVDSLHQRFRVTPVLLPVGTLHDLEANISQDILEKWAADLHDQIEDLLWQAISGPRQVLNEAIEEVQQRLRSGKRVTVRTLNPLREAIELVKSFASVSGDELLTHLSSLEQQVTQAQSVLSAASGTGQFRKQLKSLEPALMQAMQGVVESIHDEQEVAKILNEFGKQPRRLRME